MTGKKLTVVIAVEHSQRNLSDILAAITVPGNGPDETIIAHAMDDDTHSELKSRFENIVLIKCRQGSRIPHMWAEGFRRAQGTFVALTTAHCVPEQDWIEKILSLDMPEDLAGVGGVFRNSGSASALDWAVFLQRYRQYPVSGQRREVAEIAADNAVYRRSAIMACEDLLEHGFWEPEFHARFRTRGLKLVMDPSLVVIHRNLYTFRQFAAQRIVHGTEFGAARAAKLSILRNLVLLMLSPALWLLFLYKIVSASIRVQEYRIHAVKSFPWLLIFVLCWGLGESTGYLQGLSRRHTR